MDPSRLLLLMIHLVTARDSRSNAPAVSAIGKSLLVERLYLVYYHVVILIDLHIHTSHYTHI